MIAMFISNLEIFCLDAYGNREVLFGKICSLFAVDTEIGSFEVFQSHCHIVVAIAIFMMIQ